MRNPRDIEAAAGAGAADENFELEANEEMCFYCFDTLLREIVTENNGGRLLPPEEHAPLQLSFLPLDLQQPASTSNKNKWDPKSPLFITWDKRTGEESDCGYRLRGCIGILSPQPLRTAIREYALLAAFQDRRFRPIEAREVKDLRVAVSLLVRYEPCEHVYDWRVGVHGILIKFSVANGPSEQYSATFLPEVAKEQHWTPQETVEHLIRKSGYSGPIEDKLLQAVRCTRYQSSKCRVTYQDYVARVGGVDPLQTIVPEKKRWCFSL